MRTAVALVLAVALVGCASLGDGGEPRAGAAELLERSLQAAVTISASTVTGAAAGAFVGLLMPIAAGCVDLFICPPVMAATTVAGALAGGLKGLQGGIADAQRQLRRRRGAGESRGENAEIESGNLE